jgi:hypothetical protein
MKQVKTIMEDIKNKMEELDEDRRAGIMNTEQIKDELMRHAERLMELAQRLSEHGKPLRESDYRLVRDAIASGSAFERMISEIDHSFRVGNIDDFELSMNQLSRLVDRLIPPYSRELEVE